MASDKEDRSANGMNEDSTSNEPAATRSDEAVAWYVRVGSSDADEVAFAEFAAWLENDPANRAAFEKIEDFDERLGKIVLRARQEDASLAAFPFRPQRVGGRPAKWIAGVVAIAAAMLLAFFLLNPNSPSATHYATAVGQSRTVFLPDGSKIEMNTATSVSVRLSASARRVTLDRGEAVFRVRHELNRPFTVHVGDREVRDVDTVFDVVRHDGFVAIAVADGQVAVTSSAGGEPTLLGAGERLRHSEGTNSSDIDHVDPKWVTAWQSGYLVYRKAPLPEVVADLNRYFRRRIVVEGSAASSQQFSGVLRIRDEDTALAQLTAFLPIMAIRESGGNIRLQAVKAKP